MAGTGKGKGSLEQQIICIKYTLFFFNALSWVIATVTFGLTIWVRFDLDFEEWVQELKFYQFWDANFVIMAAMLIIMVVSFFGCCGAIMESPCMLLTFAVLLGICFILEMAGAACVLSYGIEDSPVLTDWLREKFLNIIDQYDTNERARRIMIIIQEYVRCCGADGSEDYLNIHKEIPDECRDPVTGSEFPDGCVEAFAWWLEDWSGSLGGICLTLAVMQIIGIGFSICLTKAIRKEASSYK